jgi:hypothetical protein
VREARRQEESPFMERKRFEYKFIEVSSFSEDTEKWINDLGKDGWELASVYPIYYQFSESKMLMAQRLRFFFKRELAS